MLALFNFAKQTRLFTGFFEPAEGLFESFVIANTDQCHLKSPSLLGLVDLRSPPGVTKPMPSDNDFNFMRHALELAARAAVKGEVPVGALVVYDNQVIAEAYNERETRPSALAHAEILALERATQKLGRWRLSGCTLYVTLEPCVMCAGALVQSRVDRVVYGAKDPKAGAVESLYQVLSDVRLNHRPEVSGGILKEDCGTILSEFFKRKRERP